MFPASASASTKLRTASISILCEKALPAPHFWTRRGDRFIYRGMFSEVPVAVERPGVRDARRSHRLRALGRQDNCPPKRSFIERRTKHRCETSDRSERPYPWGNAAPDEARGNFDFHHWDPVDVNANPAGDSASGVSQLVGNGWEWTATKFGPFPGFQPMPFYPGYSQNFFDEEHYVMKGGSPVTAACMLRRSFRNWFRPNYPYVYASFRLVED